MKIQIKKCKNIIKKYIKKLCNFYLLYKITINLYYAKFRIIRNAI